MNEVYPQTPAAGNLQAAGLNPEEEYRQQLVGEVVAESVGTVGLYSSLALAPSEQTALETNAKERTGKKPLSTDGDGWDNYGDRRIGSSQYGDTYAGEIGPNNSKLKSDKEQLHFVDMPDKRVNVGYGFMSSGYDASGRPGNVLMMSFLLKPETAQKLKEAVAADPSFVNEVVHGQVLALGFSETRWKGGTIDGKHVDAMEPHYGATDFVREENRQLTVIEHGWTVEENKPALSVQNEVRLTYGKDKSILLPEAPVAVEDPAIAAYEQLKQQAIGNYTDMLQDYFPTAESRTDPGRVTAALKYLAEENQYLGNRLSELDSRQDTPDIQQHRNFFLAEEEVVSTMFNEILSTQTQDFIAGYAVDNLEELVAEEVVKGTPLYAVGVPELSDAFSRGGASYRLLMMSEVMLSKLGSDNLESALTFAKHRYQLKLAATKIAGNQTDL